MTHAITNRHRDDRVTKPVLFALFLAVIGATNVAFIFGLIATLSWPESLVVILAAGALAGGAVFTVLEMHRLGKEGR